VPPTSLLFMESVDAKIQRAHHHLRVLTAELTDLSRNYKPTMVLKHDDRDVWLVVYHKSPYAELSVSTIFGDFLHNARSSLDSLVHGLIRKVGQAPRWDTSFPIYATQSKYEERTKPGTKADVLAGLTDEARSLISLGASSRS
jgi:hypothetical protein